MCKNIVLSGVNSLTILDTRLVEEKHSATNFLLRTNTGKSFAGKITGLIAVMVTDGSFYFHCFVLLHIMSRDVTHLVTSHTT